jgi:multiple sugar transport system permease protein
MRLPQRKLVFTVLSLLLLAVFLFPIYWIVVSSLETQTQIFHNPPFLIPPTPSLASYSTAMSELGRYLVNSIVISFGTVAVSLLIGAPAAFALAHLRVRFTLVFVLALLITQMVPDVTLATPLFLLFNRANLIDTYPGLILADSTYAVPFVILTLRAFMLSVPFDLVEAGFVDGSGLLGTFWRIIIPVALPGLATSALFAFLFAWGDFTFGLTLTTATTVQPVTVGLYTFVGQYSTAWNNLMAGSILAALPTVLLLVLAQRYIRAGLTTGAVRG